MTWWLFYMLAFVLVVAVVTAARSGSGGHGLAPPPPGARWEKDPTGRHELRLWDGRQWTANVSDSGRSGWDPLQ